MQASDPTVEFAEPDVRFTPQSKPYDAEFSRQWSLFYEAAGINALSAWDVTTGSEVRVAVVDTGYRTQADLAQKIAGGYDVWTGE